MNKSKQNTTGQPDLMTQQIKQQLDNITVDDKTLQGLKLARYRALDSEQTRSNWKNNWLNWKPAAAMASVVVISITVWLSSNPSNQLQPVVESLTEIENIEMLSSTDELEMYQNLEFYLWLDEQQQG
ncbi:MAG: hypothetical protein ACI8P9_005751 [Parasphingorhabdus sp.]|jgi:hypothetical protein